MSSAGFVPGLPVLGGLGLLGRAGLGRAVGAVTGFAVDSAGAELAAGGGGSAGFFTSTTGGSTGFGVTGTSGFVSPVPTSRTAGCSSF
jgi:hypothetical protein